MIERYFKIRAALDTDDDDIVSLMPTRRQENRLSDLLSELGDFQSATMKLQDDSLTLLDVRDIFDALVEKYDAVKRYLAADASIVKDPEFEEACVLALAGRSSDLTSDQQMMLQPFETAPAHGISPSSTSNKQAPGFADQILAARKRQRTARKVFGGVQYIPPISNTVERLFSVAKHTLSHHRQGLLPVHLETVLFLKLNRRFWNAATVAKVVNES